MAIIKLQKSNYPPSPNMYLGASCPEMVSLCLTAPDKSGTLAEQTRQILDIIEGHLFEVRSSRKKLLMAQVWLADISGFPEFRDIWNAWIDADNIPALSVVEAQVSRRDSLVEIRAYAAPGNSITS